ncbi:hypothetical protein AX15_007596 [Amanita polypyramis BW_CC]|nr:hypothetical protein AX15_007596 [Amanita polypyramis BW_CC]
MRTHGRHSRRSRGDKGADEQYVDLRGVAGDEIRSESYSRPHHTSRQSQGYMSHSSLSGRGSYEMDREPSSTRSHRDSDSWRRGEPQHDRYDYPPGDEYRRGGRGEYTPSRGANNWRNRYEDTSYPESRDNWSQQYEQSYSAANYHDPSWSTSSVTPYESRSGAFEPRRAEEDREHGHEEHGHVQEDKPVEGGSSGWHRDQRRERGGHQFQSDSGWNSRRGGREWDETTRWDESSSHRKRQSDDNEDRSWEPGPSWQLTNQDQNVQRQNGHRHYHKQSKGGKKQSQQKHKRDWRNDDSNLNNWTRREMNPLKEKSKLLPRKKHLRSNSRSRSRSPAGSYHSHHSSQGRSKSRSTSPALKRRRRDSSPIVPSRTPSDRGRTGWVPRPPHNAHPSRSPSLSRTSESFSARRRSLSSASSSSTDRSPSRTPPNRPRAVHRLPASSSITTIPPMLSRASGNSYNRHSGPHHRNGKHRANYKYTNNDRRSSLVHSSSLEVMPPPDIIPSSHTSRSTTDVHDWESNRGTASQACSPRVESKIDMPSPTPTRITYKNAGFKPIVQPSSSLKKFFPGDDEDMDLASDDLIGDGLMSSQNGPADLKKSTIQNDSRYQRNGIPEEYTTRSPAVKAEEVQLSPNLQDRPPSGRLLTEPKDILKTTSGPCTPSETVPVREGGSPSAAASRELYKILSQVGEGTFGKVYKAQNTITRVHVALKRIRMEAEKDGFPVTAMREIKLLQSLRHENVVRLYEMMVSNGAVYMVFEYMDHDLTGILSQTQFTFSSAHLKSLCHQMLAGLAYLHHKGVIHRDIKGSNILVNNRGELKLADFGLARFYHKRRHSDYTNRVITLWYRPPELLFGATVYGPEVDMWSAGCIMLELFTKKPVFQGNDEIHQLDVIYKIFGTPTVGRWPAVMNLPWFELIKPKENIPNHFRELFQKWMSPTALDLAEKLLAYDPSQRIMAVQAMDAPYFTEEQPPAERPVGLSTLEGEWHELETKKERARKRKKESAI